MIENLLTRKFDFIGIGTQKAGTTALWKYILKHPDVEDIAAEANMDSLTYAKEPNLFNMQKILPQAEALLDKFNSTPSDKLLGEFTVHYIDNEYNCLERIYKHNPDVKIICILRDPSSRTYSAYNWVYNPLNKPEWREPLSKFLDKDTIHTHNFIKKSRVGSKVKHVLEVFPPTQVKFIKYETFINNQKQTVEEVLAFLGLDLEKYTYQFAEMNKRSYIEKIKPEHRQQLVEFFMDDIIQIEETLGWDCTDWKK